jgi:hypothetical protein
MSKYFDSKDLTFMEPQVKSHGQHMIMTNVHPETKTKYVNIDTRFQEEYNMQDYADCIFKLPQQISNVKSMKITHAEVPASFYPFSKKRGNTFFKITEFNNNDNNMVGQRLIKIEDRHYTSSKLITCINELIAVSYQNLQFSLHYNVDEDPNGLCSSTDIKGDVNKVEFFLPSTADKKYRIEFDLDENGNKDRNYLKSKLGWCLGFREPVYEITPGKELVAEGTIDINPFHYLYISVDDFHAHNPNSFIVPSTQSYINPNILARVSLDPTTYAFGGLIVASNVGGKMLTDKRSYEGKNNIQKLRVQILDEFGRVVDLNKMDFSFALELTYE